MKILGIETSCDETAVCIIEATGGTEKPVFEVLGNGLYSQVKIHAEYGGVFPNVAKREHAKNLTLLLEKALREADLWIEEPQTISPEMTVNLIKILEREHGLAELLLPALSHIKKPDVDLIAVTAGPGLEPALWVGISFALALGEIWNIPVMPTNHMEGHILSPLLEAQKNPAARTIEFPAIALLISGGHTELVLVTNWTEYKKIGQTRDDAVGEAFDKVARVLSLPYPGGPEISKLAEKARELKITSAWSVPRPMIKTPDFDFSFSGIKTSVLYTVRDIEDVNDDVKMQIALEFENAATEVLVAKTQRAIDGFGAKTLIIGGGVIANTHIRRSFEQLATQYADFQLLLPDLELSTDNAVMIAIAGYFDYLAGKEPQKAIKAQGNLSL